jgi:hypothetical protein
MLRLALNGNPTITKVFAMEACLQKAKGSALAALRPSKRKPTTAAGSCFAVPFAGKSGAPSPSYDWLPAFVS